MSFIKAGVLAYLPDGNPCAAFVLTADAVRLTGVPGQVGRLGVELVIARLSPGVRTVVHRPPLQLISDRKGGLASHFRENSPCKKHGDLT